MHETRIFKVIFRNHDRLFEIYASGVTQGALFGFVEVEQVLFGERSQLVVDPSEESIKNEFKGVKRFYVPLHSVVRIDEVEKQGVSRVAVAQTDGNLMPFPTPLPVPTRDPKR